MALGKAGSTTGQIVYPHGIKIQLVISSGGGVLEYSILQSLPFPTSGGIESDLNDGNICSLKFAAQKTRWAERLIYRSLAITSYLK